MAANQGNAAHRREVGPVERGPDGELYLEVKTTPAAALLDLEIGSDEEVRWRGEWLSRLMFGWMIGQRDPGTYEEWLTANGARLV